MIVIDLHGFRWNIFISAIPCKDDLWVHTLKSNKLVLAIDNSEITNREISQNQDTHGLLRLKTKTSFRHLIKYITYKNSTERESEFRVVMSWNIIHAVAKNQIKNIR